MGKYALERFRELQKKHEIISDVRGVGLIIGIELEKNNQRATDEAEQVMYAALSRGLSFKITMGNILLLSPPLNITKEEMNQAIRIIDESITEIKNNK